MSLYIIHVSGNTGEAVNTLGRGHRPDRKSIGWAAAAEMSPLRLIYQLFPEYNCLVMEEPSRRLGELLGEPAKSFSASLLAESPVFVGNFCGSHHIKSRGIVIYHVYYC